MTLLDVQVPQRTPPASNVLRIRIATGTGIGPTPLAAFDAALGDAGVANYNLICLSSVIPPHARIERARHVTRTEDYGRRLYVVLSQMRETRAGHRACAGIGWLQQHQDGRGLFVELHDSRRDRLQHDIERTLTSMQHQRGVRYGAVDSMIAEARCERDPVCALVIAVYKCEPW